LGLLGLVAPAARVRQTLRRRDLIPSLVGKFPEKISRRDGLRYAADVLYSCPK
jgi:hypothetical protein